MDINTLFNSNACDPRGLASKSKRTWIEYWENKKILEAEWHKVILVDMIHHPVENAVPISNELFAQLYPAGTYFVLYCHSWGSSWYVQMQLQPALPQYHIINMAGGIGMYEIQKQRFAEK